MATGASRYFGNKPKQNITEADVEAGEEKLMDDIQNNRLTDAQKVTEINLLNDWRQIIARDNANAAAGAVLVLEEKERAEARGADIVCEIVGYGLSGDAHHITEPDPTGAGPANAMLMALADADLEPSDIDYINAHGTSTPLGDELELGAVRRLFGNAIGTLSMSSTKSAIGHLLGGAGAVESIFCILAMRDSIVPPTLNLDNPDEGAEGVDLVPLVAKERPVKAVLNNSFGFGGTNASLVMKAL